MAFITAHDAGGQAVFLFQKDGYNYVDVPCLESTINIHTVPVRVDDVFICGFPKSGSHWLWDTIRMLLAGRLLHDTTEMGSCQLEYAPHTKISALPSPRLLNTHFRLRHLSPDIVKKCCKIIYIIRNPKDVAVSMYNFMRHQVYYNYDGKWEDFLEPFMLGEFAYGSWFDYVQYWEEEKKKHPVISTVYYEDMKKDPLQEIRRMNRILETHRSEEFLSDLCDFTTFSKMSQRKQSSSAEEGGAFQKTYRKGEVGDWKNWFTVAQNEWFDKLYHERMKGTDLKIQFTLE